MWWCKSRMERMVVQLGLIYNVAGEGHEVSYEQTAHDISLKNLYEVLIGGFEPNNHKLFINSSPIMTKV